MIVARYTAYCIDTYLFPDSSSVVSQIKQLIPSATTAVYKMVDLLSAPFRSPSTVAARCDMDTDSGGWIVIQRRVANGTVNFTRGWYNYQNGFGDLEGEFWYGLNNIHYLTSQENVDLRIDMIMEDDGSNLSWTYQTFHVAGASDNYSLTIGDGQGSGQDAMAYHNQQQFTTYDNDNAHNCGYRYKGGWWYNECYRSNLNGPHSTPTYPGVDQTFARLILNDGTYRDVASVEMKIRAKQCTITTDDPSC